MKILEGISAVLCIFYIFYAIKSAYEIRKKVKTSFKAVPESLFPSAFFRGFFTDDQVESMCEKEDGIAATTTISQNACSNIAENIISLEKTYSEALRHCAKNQLGQMSKLTDVCKKAIQSERDSFLTDNGDTATNFIFDRQNKFTDYLMTSILIPIIIELINVGMMSWDDIWLNLCSNFFFIIATCTLFVIFSYRLHKYYRNKKSLLTSQEQIILYNKGEIMLCCFETALKKFQEK